MATLTPNLGLSKPVVGADDDVWGSFLNGNSDIIDSAILTKTQAATTYAPINSPALIGNPTAPTPTMGDNDTSIATTAFVAAAVAGGGVTSFNTRTGAVTLGSVDVTSALTFTPYNATNPAGYQTAANVTTALAAYLPLAGGTLSGALSVAGTVSGAGFTALLAPYAPLASPVFTGTPTLPTGSIGVTQTAGNSTTALATTAFVTASLGGYLPLVGGTLSGTLTAPNIYVNGGAYYLSNSGGSFLSDAVYTAIKWDTGNWRLRYTRSNGTLEYIRGSDSVPILSITGAGAFAVLGGATFNGLLNNTGNIQALAAGGNAFVGSWHTSSSNVGFWSNSNILYFGNADSNGAVISSRANIDASGSLTCNGNVTGARIRATNSIMSVTGAFYVADNESYYLARGSGGAWRFVENGTINFTLDTAGTLTTRGAMYCTALVGSTNVQAPILYANGNNMVFSAGGSGSIMQFQSGWYWDWNNSTGTLIWMSAAQGAQWIIHANGSCYNNVTWTGGRGPYQDLSDERQKVGIRPAAHGLDAILALEPINFRRLRPVFGKPTEDEREDVGFSAQQVQRVIPEAVNTMGDEGTLCYGTTPIIAALVNAVQTLNARLAALEARA